MPTVVPSGASANADGRYTRTGVHGDWYATTTAARQATAIGLCTADRHAGAIPTAGQQGTADQGTARRNTADPSTARRKTVDPGPADHDKPVPRTKPAGIAGQSSTEGSDRFTDRRTITSSNTTTTTEACCTNDRRSTTPNATAACTTTTTTATATSAYIRNGGGEVGVLCSRQSHTDDRDVAGGATAAIRRRLGGHGEAHLLGAGIPPGVPACQSHRR